jgi:hypothetical protein
MSDQLMRRKPDFTLLRSLVDETESLQMFIVLKGGATSRGRNLGTTCPVGQVGSRIISVGTSLLSSVCDGAAGNHKAHPNHKRPDHENHVHQAPMSLIRESTNS